MTITIMEAYTCGDLTVECFGKMEEGDTKGGFTEGDIRVGLQR